MRWLRAFLIRLAGVMKPARDGELEAELDHHLRLQIEANIRAGMDASEALRAARIKLGSIQTGKEDYRDRKSLPMFDAFIRDFRYAVRSLRHNPGFALVAIATLALGIGANTAVFSVVNGVLLRPLPYPDASRLGVVRLDLGPIRDVSALSLPECEDLRREASLLEGVTCYSQFPGQFLTTGEDSEPVNTGAVWYNYFSVLGIEPMLGRDFHKGENNNPAVANVMILSYDFWKSRMGGDANVLGRSFQLGAVQTRVIGVLPPRFQFPSIQGLRGVSGVEPDVWVPINFRPGFNPPRSNHSFRSVARLKEGVTFAAAQGQLDSISAVLTRQYADYKPGGIRIKIDQMQSDIVGGTRPAILALAGAVGFVLLIACSNVATLLIARWKTREREMAIRTALGASAGMIVRQVLTESVCLALLAGCLGVGLAYEGVKLLQQLKPANLPRLSAIHIDLTVLVISAGISVLSSLLFGILPAVQTSRLPTADTLRAGTRSSGGIAKSRVMNTLVAAEVALCMLLLIASGLLIQTFIRLQRVDPGFDASHTLTFRALLQFENGQSPALRMSFYDQLQRRITAMPGVQAVGGTSILPFGSGFNIDGYAYDEATLSRFGDLSADYRTVNPSYFATLRTPLVAGRFFNDQDGRDARVPIIVDDILANAAWPNRNPIGRRFWITDGGGPALRPMLGEIVGVVRHLRMHQLNEVGDPQIFVPPPVAARAFLNEVTEFVVRLNGDPRRIAPAIRQAAKELNRFSAPVRFETLQDRLDRATAGAEFELILMSIFAGIAMVMALVGLYGVISYTVNERWRELGIRIALGARPGNVFGLVLRQGMRMSMVGIAIGAVAALGLTPLLRSMLYGVAAFDALTYASVAVMLAAVSALACFVPARRAMLADPIEAMHSE